MIELFILIEAVLATLSAMTRDEMAIDDDALAPAATGTDVTADGPGTEGANEPEPHPSAAWSEEELQACGTMARSTAAKQC